MAKIYNREDLDFLVDVLLKDKYSGSGYVNTATVRSDIRLQARILNELGYEVDFAALRQLEPIDIFSATNPKWSTQEVMTEIHFEQAAQVEKWVKSFFVKPAE